MATGYVPASLGEAIKIGIGGVGFVSWSTRITSTASFPGWNTEVTVVSRTSVLGFMISIDVAISHSLHCRCSLVRALGWLWWEGRSRWQIYRLAVWHIWGGWEKFTASSLVKENFEELPSHCPPHFTVHVASVAMKPQCHSWARVVWRTSWKRTMCSFNSTFQPNLRAIAFVSVLHHDHNKYWSYPTIHPHAWIRLDIILHLCPVQCANWHCISLPLHTFI